MVPVTAAISLVIGGASFLPLIFHYFLNVHVLCQAYAWGFDICRWRCHLNALTWPEILRQFALSAGFGPKLKKRNTERPYFHENEVCSF